MATSFPRAIQVCGVDLAFLIINSTFHCQWHIVRVRFQPPCSGKFAIGKAVMVEVVDVLEAKCHYCSSKPCLLFGPFEHKSLQRRRIVQCKKVNCEVVSGHQFSRKMIQFCVGEDLAFLTVDFTFHGQWPFHGQWHVFQVRYQPLCSSRFACLGSHASHAYGQIWASFSGQVGCKLNRPLPQRKSAVIFR